MPKRSLLMFGLTLLAVESFANDGAPTDRLPDPPVPSKAHPSLTPKARRLTDISLSPKLPEIQKLPNSLDARSIERSPSVVEWVAPGTYVQPSFFEDTALERYGLSRYPRLQPVVSAKKFAIDSILFPVRAVRQHPRQVRPILGFERPGNPK